MITHGFKKITPLNGFSSDKGNARQNDYAWAMEELGDYLYTGTGRNIPNLAFDGLGLPVPKAFLPNDDYRAEIWRLKKDGGTDWELDFKTPSKSYGFRYMIQFPENSRSKRALYAAATSSDGSKAVIYRRTVSSGWSVFAELEGGSSRSMVEHLGRLYVATVPLTSAGNVPKLFILNESQTSFEAVSLPPAITGEITSMISFNNRLYIGLAKEDGLDVWRTDGAEPCSGWKLVVDKGAGDAINSIPFVMDQFEGAIYLGTGMIPFLPLLSGVPVITKGFDMIKISRNDTWKVVVGGLPMKRTKPSTGQRNLAMIPSGFGNPFNVYCWQIRSYKGSIYAGSFDWTSVIPPALQSLCEAIWDGEADALLTFDEEVKTALESLPHLKLSALHPLLLSLLNTQHGLVEKLNEGIGLAADRLPYSKALLRLLKET
ncbi:hypothetical protein ACQCVE_15730 [Metabacillus sp. 113a]|uniref:hypothetical protein n=1 Tax=Metabacillus sp. 113a TaxID=3404706 RepID=UPI003CE7870B